MFCGSVVTFWVDVLLAVLFVCYLGLLIYFGFFVGFGFVFNLLFCLVLCLVFLGLPFPLAGRFVLFVYCVWFVCLFGFCV